MAAWDSLHKRYTKLLHLIEIKGEYSPTAVTDTILTDLATLKSDIEGEATDLNTEAGNLNTQSGNINTEATQLASDYGDLNTEISTLSSYISTYGDNESILAGIVTALTTIHTSLTGVKTNLDTAKTALDTIKTNLDTVKTNLDTAATDTQSIIDDYGDKPTDQDVVDVMDKVHTDLLAKINAGVTGFAARTKSHARCSGLGWYYKSQDTGNIDDSNTKRLCPGCGAYGYIENSIVDTPTISFPTTEEAPDDIPQ